jgi:hypothetical protein
MSPISNALKACPWQLSTEIADGRSEQVDPAGAGTESTPDFYNRSSVDSAFEKHRLRYATVLPRGQRLDHLSWAHECCGHW